MLRSFLIALVGLLAAISPAGATTRNGNNDGGAPPAGGGSSDLTSITRARSNGFGNLGTGPSCSLQASAGQVTRGDSFTVTMSFQNARDVSTGVMNWNGGGLSGSRTVNVPNPPTHTVTLTPSAVGMVTVTGYLNIPFGPSVPCSNSVSVRVINETPTRFITDDNKMDGDMDLCLTLGGRSATLTSKRLADKYAMNIHGNEVVYTTGRTYQARLTGSRSPETITLAGDWSEIRNANPVLYGWRRAWDRGRMSGISYYRSGNSYCVRIIDGCCGYGGGLYFSVDWRISK